ncbi:UNVERIFIED_CONTAM: hypothetical protein HDU68_011790 [Siphonaria sp. JEL0065]|nr:hypothetical protein HDU68_011790 [Siphonaria sp. JEL0065]
MILPRPSRIAPRLVAGLESVPRSASIRVVTPRRTLFGMGASSGNNSAPKKGFKQLLAEHGPAALITYAVLSGISFAGFYVAIVSSGVDPLQLMHKLPFSSSEVPEIAASSPASKDIMDQVGDAIHAVEDAVAKGIENAEDIVGVGVEGLDAILHHDDNGGDNKISQVSGDEGKEKPYLNGTTALVAWCVHELFLPIRLGLTAYLTPRVSRRMKGGVIDRFLGSIMARFGAKGGAAVEKETSDSGLKGKLLNVRNTDSSSKK